MGAVAAGAPQPPVTLAEAKAFLRIAGSEEDALLAGLLRSAASTCEAFTGMALIERPVTEILPASPAWTRLRSTPVRAIEQVEALLPDDGAALLGADAYAIDVDGSGDGWVRVTRPGEARRVRVSCLAGLAADRNGVPEPLRHGILRLAAHLYAARGEEGGEPPAAVAALWRPWRRLRIG